MRANGASGRTAATPDGAAARPWKIVSVTARSSATRASADCACASATWLGDVAGLLGRIGVADHHLELTGHDRAQGGRERHNLAGDGLGALEISELLEQRHRPELAGREAGGAREEHDLEQVGDLAREAT